MFPLSCPPSSSPLLSLPTTTNNYPVKGLDRLPISPSPALTPSHLFVPSLFSLSSSSFSHLSTLLLLHPPPPPAFQYLQFNYPTCCTVTVLSLVFALSSSPPQCFFVFWSNLTLLTHRDVLILKECPDIRATWCAKAAACYPPSVLQMHSGRDGAHHVSDNKWRGEGAEILMKNSTPPQKEKVSITRGMITRFWTMRFYI